jgi:ABC-2 type transport system permease protein
MRTDKLLVIARREYLSRVKTKAFWFGTVILPLFMLAVTIVPSLLIAKMRGTLKVAVVDEVGGLGPALVDRLAKTAAKPPEEKAKGPAAADKAQASNIQVQLVERQGDEAAQRAELDRRVLAEELNAWVWISPAGLAKPDPVAEYHGSSVSNFITQEQLSRAISTVVSESRLRQAGYDAAKVTELTRDVDLETTRVTAEGGRAEGGLAGFFFAYILFFMLYVTIMIYGQQVMNGVLEEKTSRIVEVIISTVSPFELMMGKLLGICAVALTQIGVWFATATALTAPGVIAAIPMLAKGPGLPQISLAIFGNFVGFFVVGFFMYATFYAAIGSAFNDIKEAQQAASSASFLFILPVLLMFPVINDPGGTLATVASLVPPLTPLLMMLRVAVKTPPVWQIALGYLLAIAFTIFMVWVAAKIYRVGILMYGKKPTLKELVRWVRYA